MPGRPPATIGLVTEPGIVARRRRRQAERLLHGVRRRPRPREAELVDHRRRQDLGPAADERVGLDRLVAERRRAGAVDDAAERAGDLAIAVRIDVAAEDAVVGAGFQSPRPRSRSELSIRSAVRKKLLAPGWFGSGTRLMIAAAYGSIRPAGIVLFGERQAGDRIAAPPREDAGALVGRRHARDPRDAARDPRALEIGEEEARFLPAGRRCCRRTDSDRSSGLAAPARFEKKSIVSIFSLRKYS